MSAGWVEFRGIYLAWRASVHAYRLVRCIGNSPADRALIFALRRWSESADPRVPNEADRLREAVKEKV